MSLHERLALASGRGWSAVRLPYAGLQLALAIVLPERGRLAAVEQGLDGPGLARLLGSFQPSFADLRLPRWTFRFHAALPDGLGSLGLGVAFGDHRDATDHGRTEDATRA